MKIIIIGSNHGGTAAANTILDNYGDDVELTVYDRNDNISFLGCGMALWIGNQISKPDGLFYNNKEKMEEKGAKVFLETEIDELDTENKTIKGHHKDGEEFTDTYDKLILATGSLPRKLDIPGSDLENIKYAKIYQNAKDLKETTASDDIKKVAVNGAGYVGVELAEAFQRIGKDVILIDRSDRILGTTFDKDISDVLLERMEDKGIKVLLNTEVKEFLGKDGKLAGIKTSDGEEYDLDLIVNAIGFEANTSLGGDEFEKFSNGAYLVNKKFETSVKDVYAIGDCATEFNNATGKQDYIALATNAVRSGVVAAHNACGTELESLGVQGSSALKVYDLCLIGTGLNLDTAERAGIEVLHTDFKDKKKGAFMEIENPEVKVRIVYRKDNRKIVGAQLISEYDVSMGIHLFSLAIQEGLTVDELALTDLFFMPHYNQPYNYITMAALTAE